MTYKIVQTIEQGKKALVVVPHFWENKGTLWWPPKKKLFKLMKDEQSKPTKEWKTMKCTLKRKNIKSYQDADDELGLMEENSDTDVQDNDTVPSVLPNQNEEINFELLAANLKSGEEYKENLTFNYGDVAATVDVDSATVATDSDNYVQILNAENVSFDQFFLNQRIISEKIDNMINIQNKTLCNQKKLAQELAAQSVLLQNITTELLVLKEKTGLQNVTLLAEVQPEDRESFSIKPISNQRELIMLDQSLADKKQQNKLRQQLSFLCNIVNGAGITCAYKLLDILFTREFLCLCSWAGGSRGDQSKVAIKDYKNVLNFFYSMVHTWDPTYTYQENEKFFKTITKNSTQRKAMKNLRMSAMRRSKKGKKNENENQSTKQTIQTKEHKILKDEIKEKEEENKETRLRQLNNDANKKEEENMDTEEQALINDANEKEEENMEAGEPVLNDVMEIK